MFVVPENDAESVAIKDMLADSGEDFVVTKQQCGASWDGLEDDVKQRVRTIWSSRCKQSIQVLGAGAVPPFGAFLGRLLNSNQKFRRK